MVMASMVDLVGASPAPADLARAVVEAELKLACAPTTDLARAAAALALVCAPAADLARRTALAQCSSAHVPACSPVHLLDLLDELHAMIMRDILSLMIHLLLYLSPPRPVARMLHVTSPCTFAVDLSGGTQAAKRSLRPARRFRRWKELCHATSLTRRSRVTSADVICR